MCCTAVKHIDDERENMFALTHEIVKKKGKDFALIPYSKFLELCEQLEDAEDLRVLDAARADALIKNERTYSMDEVRKILDCPRKKSSRAPELRKKIVA